MERRNRPLEDVGKMITPSFWQHKRVLLTGHTGFKGSWLSILLSSMGAEVTGFALAPQSSPSMFEICGLDKVIRSRFGDIRDRGSLMQAMREAQPQIVIHMAAQALVRESYVLPAETYEINVMGTVHLMEAVRQLQRAGTPIRAVLNVTSDKVYDNKEWVWAYRETERLGGFDPYASSKACSELVTDAYRNSFFPPDKYGEHGVAVATARAGNVIGGGDWSRDRLIPDLIRAVLNNEKIRLRYPRATRPWQHVLDPLNGYLQLAEKLASCGVKYASAWNFGANPLDTPTVEQMAQDLSARFGKTDVYEVDNSVQPHEHHFLALDSSKANHLLGWQPTWDVRTALDKIVDWVQAYRSGCDMMEFSLRQVHQHLRDSS